MSVSRTSASVIKFLELWKRDNYGNIRRSTQQMVTFGRSAGKVGAKHKLAAKHPALKRGINRPVNVGDDVGNIVILELNTNAFRRILGDVAHLLDNSPHDRGGKKRGRVRLRVFSKNTKREQP
jgi:hypothetical protein